VPDTKTNTKGDYQAPVLRVLGSLHSMTLVQDKTFGASDGFTFMGVAITNASP
jgi:hypothetical protein